MKILWHNTSKIKPAPSDNARSLGQTGTFYSDLSVSVQKFRVLPLNTVMMLMKRMGLIFG